MRCQNFPECSSTFILQKFGNPPGGWFHEARVAYHHHLRRYLATCQSALNLRYFLRRDVRATVILCFMLQARYAIGSLLSLDQEPWVPRTNPIRIRQAISQFGVF